MPQPHMTWMYVAQTMACSHAQAVTIIAFLQPYDFPSARRSKAKVHHGKFDHADTARGRVGHLRRAQKTSRHLAGPAIQHRGPRGYNAKSDTLGMLASQTDESFPNSCPRKVSRPVLLILGLQAKSICLEPSIRRNQYCAQSKSSRYHP